MAEFKRTVNDDSAENLDMVEVLEGLFDRMVGTVTRGDHLDAGGPANAVLSVTATIGTRAAVMGLGRLAAMWPDIPREQVVRNVALAQAQQLGRLLTDVPDYMDRVAILIEVTERLARASLPL